MKRYFLSIAFALLFTPVANAEVIGVAGGCDAPAPTLGPYQMTPFPPDPRPLGDFVTSVPSPLGGELGFSIPMSHRRIGEGWSTWSHGYTGDVYYTYSQSEVTIELPGGTRAFYFYVEPNVLGGASFIATADDGTSVEQFVAGSYGASYFGFFVDDPGDSPIESITVVIITSYDFAIGEFGISTGAPAPISCRVLDSSGTPGAPLTVVRAASFGDASYWFEYDSKGISSDKVTFIAAPISVSPPMNAIVHVFAPASDADIVTPFAIPAWPDDATIGPWVLIVTNDWGASALSLFWVRP